jgi:hypothetical protein
LNGQVTPPAEHFAPQSRAALVAHGRELGLPAYAQFDNDTVFQGAHQYPDTIGRVARLCLSLHVVPMFAPPARDRLPSHDGKLQRVVAGQSVGALRASLLGRGAGTLGALCGSQPEEPGHAD